MAAAPRQYTHGGYWAATNAGEEDRRQSTTPQNALRGLPNQRPVQIFNSPGLYGIPPNQYDTSRGRKGTASEPAMPTAGRERPALKTEDTPEQKAINFCARWADADCSAFDDANFRRLCGMCLSARGPGQVAGLYYDRKNPNDLGMTDPSPTTGTCAPRAFVVDKATCETRKRQLFCESEGSFSDPQCAVCTTDAAMKYVPASASGSGGSSGSSGPILRLFGRGTVIVNIAGVSGSAPGSEAKPLYSGPLNGQPISLKGIREGTTLYIRVGGDSVGGVLIGQTRAGPYSVDISKIITVDTVSGQAPRREGYIGIGGSSYVFRIMAAKGATGIMLPLRIPFEFVDTPACSTGPVVRTAKSAEQLNMGECSGPRAVPGNYGLPCLKKIWEVNGCSVEGRGYPNDIKKAPELLWDENSTARSLAQIHEYIRALALTARTGLRTDGLQAKPREVEAARVACLGKSLLTPCSTRESGGGLTAECMQEIYLRAGGRREGQLWPDSEGAVVWANQHGGATGNAGELERAYRAEMVIAADAAAPQQERLRAIQYMYGITYKQLRESDLRTKVMGRAPVQPSAQRTASIEGFRGGGSGLPGF